MSKQWNAWLAQVAALAPEPPIGMIPPRYLAAAVERERERAEAFEAILRKDLLGDG